MRRPSLVLAAGLIASVVVAAPAGGAPAQTTKRGGMLVIAAAPHTEPACLNLFVSSCNAPSDLRLVLPGAFKVTPSATFRPDLVSSARVVSRNPFTLLYRIRPKARWSDRVPVTASDFVFTYQAQRNTVPSSPTILGSSLAASARSERRRSGSFCASPTQTGATSSRWSFRVTRLRGATSRASGRMRSTIPRTGRRIGSGPFLFGGWDRGKELTLVKNPRYWGPHTAYLDRLVYRFLPAQVLAEAMRKGEIDMIDPVASQRASIIELDKEHAPGIRVFRTPATSFEVIAIRQGPGGHPALQGKRGKLVRQALAYGIDRVTIARTIGTPLEDALPTKPLDNFVLLPEQSPYYRPNWKTYRYRPAHAGRLLEQAGCRRGQDRIYSCGGERLALRFLAPANVEGRQRTVELAQQQLRQVGVDVRAVYAPSLTLYGEILPSGDFDLMIFSYGMGASTAGPFTIFGCQQEQNFYGYCDRLVTRDLDQATRIIDLRRRVGLLNRVDARLAKAVPALPLFQGTKLLAAKATVRGIVPNGVGMTAWNAEHWWLER